ncbi:MAG: hypothetical protein H7Z40_08065 [Phycisphaerae bacterium]|nr:hypothetical protein [Gemmatimonadaceae bacterium]
MYATCLYCSANLGSNEVVEAFPVGRRLAFDAVHGRLWVVCRGCERWNLSPLEERWEAIEQAERLYHDSRLRVSTDNIGLARLREGLELVRIGEPQRPEMAAWRYGDQFGRRRNRQLIWSGAAVAAAAGLYAGMGAIGVSMVSFTGVIANGGMWDAIINGSPKKVVGRIVAPDGQLLVVQRRHARMSAVLKSESESAFELRLEHSKGAQILYGAEAMRAAAQILPTVNRFGGSKAAVNTAVSFLEEAGGPNETLARIQKDSGAADRMRPAKKKQKPGEVSLTKLPGVLHALPITQRLALEMALHEEQERRAMEGELAELEKEWRDADNIARISDSLLDTPEIEGRLSELKSAADKPD